MRTGEPCPIGSRFDFDMLKDRCVRNESKLRGAGAIVSGDGKRPEQYFGKSNVCMALVETAAVDRGHYDQGEANVYDERDRPRSRRLRSEATGIGSARIEPARIEPVGVDAARIDARAGAARALIA
jgi:hypothetical protein